MTYKGHVENGKIVLDEPAELADGDLVRVERVEPVDSGDRSMPLRGTKCEFPDPFTPAVPEEDWDALK